MKFKLGDLVSVDGYYEITAMKKHIDTILYTMEAPHGHNIPYFLIVMPEKNITVADYGDVSKKLEVGDLVGIDGHFEITAVKKMDGKNHYISESTDNNKYYHFFSLNENLIKAPEPEDLNVTEDN